MPEPKDPFEGPKLKIERAKHHIADFRAMFKALDNTDFVRVYIDDKLGDDGKARLMSHHMTLPRELRLPLADALYNLRSALDQAVSRCAVLANKSPKQTYFPHGRDKAGFEASMRAKCKEVPVTVRRAIAELEPYYGGDGFLLQAVHDLNLIDKHTELLKFNITFEEGYVAPGASPYLPIGGRWYSAKNKLDIAEHYIRNSDKKIQLACTISFREIAVIEGQPATKVIYQICDLVARTVSIIEARMNEHLQSNG